MSQQFGLGRGLASLIPQKKKTDDRIGITPSKVFPVTDSVFETAEDSSRVSFGKSEIQTDKSETGEDHSEIRANSKKGKSLEIALEKITPNPHQPRMYFDKEKLEELIQSVKEHGILQPLIVSPRGGEHYELIAGERRLQAAKQAGLTSVPVIVRDASEQEKLEFAIIENIQRHNLNPIEEAKAFLRLIDEFGMQQEAVAKKMGKSRSAVANTLRLLHLPIEIQRAVAEGKISEGHAKALLAIENPEKQRAVFDLVIKEELTVRETEMKVRSISIRPHVRSIIPLNPDIMSRIEHLTKVLGTKVKIAPSGKGGKVVIEYYSQEDLNGLLNRFEK